MAFQLGYFAVLAIVANGLPVKDPLGPTQPKGHRLEYLAALWRHGERAPASTFAHDLVNESFWENGYGQLTSYGIEQQRRLGKWIYNRYVKEFGYLPEEFDGKSTRIQSTWYNRTRESALYNFKGLYGESIDYEQLNILTIPKNETDVIGLPYDGCGFAHELAVEALKTNEVVQFMSKHKEWISRLFKATNYGNLSYIVDLYCVEDPIYLEERKGLKLAPEYKREFNDIFDIYVEEIKFMYGIEIKPQDAVDWRYELVKMQAGGLLTRVANDMSAKAFCKFTPDQPYCKEDNVADLKYRVFSMHDTNVLGVLNSFDFPKVDYNRNDNVELGSSLFFELWNDEEKEQKYVKIVYRRSPEEIYDLSEQISGCKSIGKGLGCSLDDFLRRTDKYLIPSFDKYCAQRLPRFETSETIPQVQFKV